MSSESGKGEVTEDQSKEFRKQIETYIAWVNSQLKKRTGTKPVTDLKKDFRDGVVLAKLVEIISSEKLDGVRDPAGNMDDKKHNINLVLKFLNSRNIRMHHITDGDVVDGNIKSLMRLILTLAAHFKPSSVGSKKSVSAAAANANVALGDIHKRVTSSGGFRSKWKSSTPAFESRKYGQGSPSSSRSISLLSNQSELARTGSEDDASFVLSKLPSGDIFASPNLPLRSKTKRSDDSLLSTPGRNLSSINSEIILSSGGDNASQLTEYYDDLEGELSNTKDLVSALQKLLLSGEIPNHDSEVMEDNCLPLQASTIDEECVILKSQLDLCQHENERLKSELADVRQECRTTSASKSALHSRTQQQDKEVLAMKQQILKLNLANENIRQEKEYSATQLDEYKRAKQALSNDLSEKNMTIKHLKDEMAIMSSQLKKIGDDSKHKLNSMQRLETQVQELSQQLRILQRYKQSAKRSGNEMTVITESLSSLRSNLPPHDSRQHIIDTLEQAVMSLSEQNQRTETPALRNNDISRSSASHSPRSRKKEISQKAQSTTVIYFTERNMTPVRAAIYKRIGEITLRDFKNILHTSDNYRYNFKALDPEFGTVKKEVFHDDEIVPGWEGKIVAWLEKDPSNHHD